ncbi:MAG: YicC family protein, partial [Gammaproteobacteria bacterium]|nr:YicC family protein [Gammaproteobacteria bacterium]
MIRSMTGFSRQQINLDGTQVIWELRTVNHRYLELSIRLPESLRHTEQAMRQQIKSQLIRGKVECTLKLEPLISEQSTIQIDTNVVSSLVKQCETLNQQLTNPAPISAIELLQWPGATLQANAGTVFPEHLRPEAKVLELLGSAIDDLNASRAREGLALKGFLLERNQAIPAQAEILRGRLPELNKAYREKLLSKLNELDIETRSERTEQELVIIAQKLDVSEELDRLDSHCQEVSRV